MVMRTYELKSTQRTTLHVLELDGYDDFEYQGYWSRSHLCRPTRLRLRWYKEGTKPWELDVILYVKWVRKDGTVAEEQHQEKDIPLTMRGHTRYGRQLEAPDWAQNLADFFGPDYQMTEVGTC